MSSRSSPLPAPDPAEELLSLMTAGHNTSGEHDPFSTPSGALQSSRSNAVLQARRLANRLSLGPYARDLENFAAEDQQEREHLMYAKLLALEQKISNIVAAKGSYSVDKALLENIKNYSLAVLLSPKLSNYKGAFPGRRVMAVIKHLNINVPANLESDRHVYTTVKASVSNELTQTRSKIKKAIGASKKSDSPQSVYQLASSLVENTQCVVTVALCARLAFLRKIHSEEGKSDTKYWDHVNDRLKMIRELSKGDDDKIQQMFAGILAQDRRDFGSTSHQTLQAQSSTNWQTTIDDVINSNTVDKERSGVVDDDGEDDSIA